MNSPITSSLEQREAPASAQKQAEACRKERSNLYVCGVNHERADLSAREHFALSRERCIQTLGRLRDERLADEAMVLSTCNRTEIYAFGPQKEGYSNTLRDFFLSLAGDNGRVEHAPPHYDYNGLEAVRHLFAVESGLNSMILGENEIKAQVRQTFEMSVEMGMSGPNLHRLIESAHHCSKRIKTETELNRGTLDFGVAAVMRAEEVIGTLEGKQCAVIGAGKIGRSAAAAIAARKPARLAIINRTPENAREIAEGLEAEIVSIPGMFPVLQRADLIIGAAFAPNFLVTRDMFEKVRGVSAAGRPICLVDAAVPRILDQAIGELPGITRLDIGDLEAIIAANRDKRLAASRKAWELVEKEVKKFKGQILVNKLAPAIGRLKDRFETTFQKARDDLGIHCSESELEKIRRAQYSLKQKLLHEAIQELKNFHSGR